MALKRASSNRPSESKGLPKGQAFAENVFAFRSPQLNWIVSLYGAVRDRFL